MKIKIDKNLHSQINANLNCLLMYNNWLYVIKSIETTTEYKKNLFGNYNSSTYIISAEIMAYNPTGHFLGTLPEESVRNFFYFHDIYKLKDNWFRFKEQLQAFGFEIVPNKIDVKEKK